MKMVCFCEKVHFRFIYTPPCHAASDFFVPLPPHQP